MKRPLTLLAVLVGACGLASCPEQEPVDPQAFMEELFRLSVICAPSFLAEAEPVFLRAQAQAQLDIAVITFQRDLDNEAIGFSRGAYDDCLARAADNDCSVLTNPLGPCNSIFVGTLEDGDVCAESAECSSGLSCFQERDSCGTCTPLAITGDSCADRNCAQGSFCDQATQVCQLQPDPATFNAGDACQQGCGGALTGLACVEGFCSPITVVGEGDACEVGPAADLYCKDSSTTHSCDGGICTKRPGLGDACTAGGACDVTEATCVQAQCVDAGQAGDPCESPLGCQLGNTCREGTCSALVDAPVPPTCE